MSWKGKSMNAISVDKAGAGMMTVCEIKEYLHIGTNAAYNLIHSNSFPVIRIGRLYRVPREKFYEWVRQAHTVDYTEV